MKNNSFDDKVSRRASRHGNRTFALLVCLALLICLASAAILAGCGSGKDEAIRSIDDLKKEGAIIGVATDTTEGPLVEKQFPKAKVEYFSDPTAPYTSVAQGKIDAFIFNKVSLATAIHNGLEGVKILDDTFGDGNTSAAAFSPKSNIPDLQKQVNQFLDEKRADGTLDEMYKRWVEEYNEEMPDIKVPTTSDIHLRVGTTGTSMPFTYYKGTDLVGYDIELAKRLAAWMGATLEFKTYDYSGIIPAAETGDIDIILANLFVTEERKKALDFSHPTSKSDIGILVRDTGKPVPELQSFSDLTGKTVSMLTGAPFEELIKSKNSKVSKFTYFNNNPDMVMAIKEHKTDAGLTNNAIGELAVNRDSGIMLLPEDLDTSSFGIAFKKGSKERADWQEAFDKIPDETREKLWKKWTNASEEEKKVMKQSWPGKNGTVKAAVCDTLEPMSYIGSDGKPAGFDVEMILLMAKELDVKVEFTGMEFSAILSSVESGKALLGAGSIIVTDERKESCDFVEYAPAAFVLMVRSSEQSGGMGFFSDLANSFQKTFLKESRWRLFAKGVMTTILITVFSVLFGTLLGFLAYMLCRSGNRIANRLTEFSVWLVQGMPVVVLLMILYYIIFADIKVPGTFVSVIGFTLIFGAAVYNMLISGAKTVGGEQLETAYALSYTDKRAFFRVIFPQALPHILPLYKGQLTALIKATAIVGYIAVQDLTKMGDIVRSRTYEAFFPLIAVAVIYFLLSGIINRIVEMLERRMDPRKRTPEEILSGIETDKRTSAQAATTVTNGAAATVHGDDKDGKNDNDGEADRKACGKIQLIGLEKQYGTVKPLSDVNCVINDGDVIAVIGPSGTGKSTLIRSINMLDRPTGGKILLDGTDITAPGYDLTKARAKMGMVFQSYNLFEHLTVIENLMLAPCDLLGKSRQEAYDTGMRLLERVGLSGRAFKYPDQLSGGQRQRIAIARTLAMDPEVILFDEPTSALDPSMIGEVESVIRDLANTGKTMMIVTHEMNFAKSVSNRVFYMDRGGIYEDGTPEQIFSHPQKELTRRFIRTLKVLEFEIESRDFDFLEAVADIDSYCIKNDISPRAKYGIRLAFDELVMQLLSGLIGRETLSVTLEHSPKEGRTSLSVSYGGERFDPKDAGNDLSYSVLKHSVDELKYEYTDWKTSSEALKDIESADGRKVEGLDSASGLNTVTAVINEEKR